MITRTVCSWICFNLGQSISESFTNSDVIYLASTSVSWTFPCAQVSRVMSKPCVPNYLLILHALFYPPLSPIISIPKSSWTNKLTETFISVFCIQISHENNHFVRFKLISSTLLFSIEFIHFIFLLLYCWGINQY